MQTFDSDFGKVEVKLKTKVGAMRHRDTFLLRLIQTDENTSSEKTAELSKEGQTLKIFLRSVSTGEEKEFESLDALKEFLQLFLQLKLNQ